MTHLNAHDWTTIFLALALLLAAAKLLAALAQRLRQPSILGEVAAGILLGPTLLGRFLPKAYAALFPSSGPASTALDTVTMLGVVFFLLAAGLETNLRSIFRQRRRALFVGLFGQLVPFAIGFLSAWTFPRFLGSEPDANRTVFALFVGTALSISALPVIAKILMDVGLLESDLGAVVLSSAMLNDLVGWILFGVVLGMVTPGGHTSVLRTIVLVLSFVVVTLTAGRWLIGGVLRRTQLAAGHGAILAMVFAVTLTAAAFAEYAGIHAIFGAFIVALAIGDWLRADISGEIRDVVTNVFAPFFFASIGLHTDFVAHFNLGITAALTAIACLSKIMGAGWGAHLAGMDTRSAWSVGFAMNARGAMEIVLGTLALQAGLIGERMFVALVVMALVTSLLAAPAVQELARNRAVAASPSTR